MEHVLLVVVISLDVLLALLVQEYYNVKLVFQDNTLQTQMMVVAIVQLNVLHVNQLNNALSVMLDII